MKSNPAREIQITAHSNTSQLLYARVAGVTFLYYIAAGITSLAVAAQSPIADVLTLSTSFAAIVLGVSL